MIARVRTQYYNIVVQHLGPFRSNPYKDFHLITTKEEDGDALRFLWLKNVAEGWTEIDFYQFCRFVFGL
jgi:hypothetical protein